MRRIRLVVGLASIVAYAGDNAITVLNQKIQEGTVHLKFDDPAGYLRSTLAALNIPIESQLLVFSKTSLMGKIIHPQNPRSIFFNDSVMAAWVRGEPFVEIVTHDAEHGLLFYLLPQRPQEKPPFFPGDGCRSCHESYSTIPVPRLMVRSIFPALDGLPVRELGEFVSDHRSPFHERWGGWYVTGDSGPLRHLGNTVIANIDKPERPTKTVHLDSLADRFDTDAYLSGYSDIVALLVFDHQMHLMNLLAHLNLDLTRGKGVVIGDAAREIADYMLFVDEAPLGGRVAGTSGFTEVFCRPGAAR